MEKSKAIIANFSQHPIAQNCSNINAFDDQFGRGNWEVIGALPRLDDIGNYATVKAVTQLWTLHILESGPITHIYINSNPIFHGLIYQILNAFPELQVPRLLWDAKRRKWWLAPPPFSRQERMDIETRSITIPAEVSEWVLSLRR